MKKIQLVETGIVVVILVLVFEFVMAVMSVLTGIFFMASGPMAGMGNTITLNLIFPLVLYLFAIYLLVMYKKPLARLINGREKEEISSLLNFSGQQLLHIAIVVICLITLINEIPGIISLLIEKISKKTGASGTENPFIIDNTIRSVALYLSLGKILFAFLILLFSRKIANLWSTNYNDTID